MQPPNSIQTASQTTPTVLWEPALPTLKTHSPVCPFLNALVSFLLQVSHGDQTVTFASIDMLITASMAVCWWRGVCVGENQSKRSYEIVFVCWMNGEARSFIESTSTKLWKVSISFHNPRNAALEGRTALYCWTWDAVWEIFLTLNHHCAVDASVPRGKLF